MKWVIKIGTLQKDCSRRKNDDCDIIYHILSKLGAGQRQKWCRSLKLKNNDYLIKNIILSLSFKKRWFHVSPERVKSCGCLICSPTANFSGTMATHSTTQQLEASYRWQCWLYSSSSSQVWGWGRSKGTSFFQQPQQRAKSILPNWTWQWVPEVTWCLEFLFKHSTFQGEDSFQNCSMWY